MLKFRRTMMLLLLISLALVTAYHGLPRLYQHMASDQPGHEQVDDWQYDITLIEKEENAVSENPVDKLPIYLLAFWIIVETMRLIYLTGNLLSWSIVIFIGLVLVSISGPMVGSITDQGRHSAEMSYSVGGAKDIDNFRTNIAAGYLPQPSDVTYEGLFYDYYFDIGADNPVEPASPPVLFRPSWSRAGSKNPLNNSDEEYLAVGLKSDLKASDFSRKKLNLVIVLDISYSMSAEFNRYFYGGRSSRMSAEERKMTKLESACRSIVAMLDHLRPDDRLGMVLFDHQAYLAKPVSLMSKTKIETLKQHILDLKPHGGTSMEDGMAMGESLLSPFADVDKSEYENRMIFMTDAMPNTGYTTETDLLGMTKKMADNGIYLSFIGMGVDFNTELIEAITKVRGANYYSVHSPAEFRKRLADEFEYMVTPMIFDLTLQVKSENFSIKKVIGSPQADLATGQIMQVKTLFPSPSNEAGGKGGVVLLQLERISAGAGITLQVSYKDRSGRLFQSESAVDFPAAETEFYDDTSIRKAVLLARYSDLLKESATLKHQPQVAVANTQTNDGSGWSFWERGGRPLQISSAASSRFKRFGEYLTDEINLIQDDELRREERTLQHLLKIIEKN